MCECIEGRMTRARVYIEHGLICSCRRPSRRANQDNSSRLMKQREAKTSNGREKSAARSEMKSAEEERLFQTIKARRPIQQQEERTTITEATKQRRRRRRSKLVDTRKANEGTIFTLLAICTSSALMILIASATLPQCQGSTLNEAKDTTTATAAATTARQLFRRSPAAILLELQRVSGSKSEPPSRPSQDWSKQKPYFGPDMARNVSVELGKTAYLTCKVYELGDKIVSWLRPRENEILTVGKFTYIGDPRFTSINDNGSHDWILEIKDVALNDSTSYECQVSTDPKMSAIINLHVKAAKARIRQGEQYYTSLGSSIEFTCEILSQRSSYSASPSTGNTQQQQSYWYHNGNLLNYGEARLAADKNFSIIWDPATQISRLKLFTVQSNDAGNYTCKPTSAEPTTIRLHVKRYNKKDYRAHQGNGHHPMAGSKEAQRNRQYYGADGSTGSLELADSGATSHSTSGWLLNLLLVTLLSSLVMLRI